MVRVRTTDSHGVWAIFCLSFADRERSTVRLGDLRKGLLEHPCTLNAVDCSGSFDLIVETCFDSLLQYQELVDGIRNQGAGLFTEFRHCLVCRRHQRARDDGADDAIWIHMANGRRRLSVQSIDKVAAEGDYVRVHSGDSSWLVHATLCAFERQLPDGEFVRLHRSLLVRRDEVVGLLHDDHGWLAQLRDGSANRVPRARAQAVRAQLGESSTLAAASSTVR